MAPAPHEGGTEALGYHAGELIAGKYQLLHTLGRGAMGAVWAVENLVLEARFALKMIRNDGAETHAAERMLREAQSAAHIEHPAIIRVFDFGVTDRGDPFLVMDLLGGVSVKERLNAEGRMSPLEAVQVLLPIADALSVAHSRGVIHRDVKPDNIMLVPDSTGRCQPTIVDFGIAKQVGAEAMRLTQIGTVIGSPEYMSPEQAQGLADIDHKTDIWSFSIALYEMVAGRTPFFRGNDLSAVLHAITEEPPPPLTDFGIDDPELSSIITRGLQKFRPGRWDDMHSLGKALAGWLLRHGIEEDASSQSIRAVWFGTSSSAPPVAIDTPAMDIPAMDIPAIGTRRDDLDGRRLAALNEPYDVPKKGVVAAGLGLAALIAFCASIPAAAWYATRVFGDTAPAMTAGVEPAPPFQAARESPPAPPVNATVLVRPDGAAPVVVERTDEPAVAPSAVSPPPDRRRTTRARPKYREQPVFVPSAPRFPEPPAPPPELPAPALDAAGAAKEESAGPPPASDNPYEPDDLREPYGSDNPYR